MLEYIDLNYKPSPKDLVAEYYVEPNKVTMEECCEQLAAESSIGTWTDLSTMSPKIAKTLKPTVYYIKKGIVKAAYNQELFEPGNMPQILSSIAGNIFGMKTVSNLRLLDVQFPRSLIKSFLGPAYGIVGIRKMLGVRSRPLTGTIVKPKVGLNEKEHAMVAYNAWIGGLDIVKDDENLTSMSFNGFETRVRETLKLRNQAEAETGDKKIYMPNVTAEATEMIKRAKFVKSQGGEYVMIDILTAGFSALQTLRKANLGLVLHAHRAMHGALTRNKQHGISMIAIAKIARLIGADQLHIGTAVGKMEGSAIETEAIEDEIEEQFISENDNKHVLEQSWSGINPVFAVCSGGLHPGLTSELVSIMGTNIIAQYGGGCHGHPDGTIAGAKAIRQSVDAALAGISLQKYAEQHVELAKALEKWQ